MTVQKVNGAKKAAPAKNVKKNNKKENKTNIQFVSSPQKKTIKTQLMSDTVKGIIDKITNSLGLKFYSKEIIKDTQSMIKKSQTHLLGLIKLYEGDPENCYEGKISSYNDKYGKKTKGFGCTKKFVRITTQEEAYEQLAKDLNDAREFAKNKINNRLGKGAFEKLPLSIQEGIIDLSFNKGPDKIKKEELLNAIKTKDYSAIVSNLQYVYSGEKKNGTEEDPGLYRRSLSRAILASRDLTDKEKTEAEQEIDKLYTKAVKCFKKNNKSTNELDDIYFYFKTGNFNNTENKKKNDLVGASNATNPKDLVSGSYKFKVDSTFKGKGAYAIARANYQTQDSDKMTFSEFYQIFNELNSKEVLDNIKVGDTVKVPQIAGANTPVIKTDSTDLAVDSTQTEKNKSGENKKDGSFFGNLISGIIGGGLGILASKIMKYAPKRIKSGLIGAGILLGIGIYNAVKFFKNNKKKDNNINPNATPFQKMLANPKTKITTDGDFEIVSLEHEVTKGNTIYNISKHYQISQDIICENNNINNPDIINIGQKLNIQKIGYKVKKDENLNQIAEKLGLNVEILRDINEIEENKDVTQGQIIELPGFTHTVKTGETLYSISKKVGVSVNKLKELNKLTSDTIHPGNIIKVIFNNSDFDVPDSMKKEIIDNETNTTTELTNVSKKYKKDFERDDILPEVRQILKNVRRVNGKVAATREVLTAEKLGVKIKSNRLKGKTIIVNAGHGYKESDIDRGAPAIGDINNEWLLNANNSIRLAKELCANGAKVIYLQGREKVVPLISNEIKKKENKADLFISVHVNAFEGKTQDRGQVYFSNPLHNLSPKNQINAKSKQLALIAEKNLDKWVSSHENIAQKDAFYLDKAKTKQDYTQVDAEPLQVCNTSENYQKIPAILWEVAFMAAPKGRERLKNNTLMNNYANVMAESIMEYFKV